MYTCNGAHATLNNALANANKQVGSPEKLLDGDGGRQGGDIRRWETRTCRGNAPLTSWQETLIPLAVLAKMGKGTL